MDICQWLGCRIALAQNQRGRPRKYCPDHARQSTAQNKRAWRATVSKVYPQCCLDWQASKPGRKICQQHQDWARFCKDVGLSLHRPDELLGMYDCDARSRNFRVALKPDTYHAQAPALSIDHESGTKVGIDRELESAADALLAKLNITVRGPDNAAVLSGFCHVDPDANASFIDQGWV